jgi:hypothetical protein
LTGDYMFLSKTDAEDVLAFPKEALVVHPSESEHPLRITFVISRDVMPDVRCWRFSPLC